MARSIPVGFLHRFVETVEQYGIRGKFSVLPCPCHLGFIGRGLEGYPESECREWVTTARKRLAGRMDFSPEVISHLSQGRATGLQALAETAQRLADAFGSRLAWRSCSELAAWTAATAALRWSVAKQDATLRLCLQAPFACDGFTVSLASRAGRARFSWSAGTAPRAGRHSPSGRTPPIACRCRRNAMPGGLGA